MKYLDKISFFPADKCPGSTSVPGRRAQHAHYATSHTTDASGEYIRSHRLMLHLTFEHTSQRASLDLFHAGVLGGVEENDAWSPKGKRRSGTPRWCRRQLEFRDVLACGAQQKPKPAPGRWKLQRLAKGLSVPETSSSAGSLGFAAEVPGV